MGILDEAIREHLELKRQHGAEESELDGLQAEAFGPADRPDAVEAETEVISPGSSLTAPAGEGDQLDKVFEATRVAGETGETELPTGETTETTAPAESPEEAIPDGERADASTPPGATEAALPAEDAIHEADTAAAGPPEPAAPSAPAADQDFDEVEGGDAGDALQRERMTLSGHPTEHYDVDAAIAEEEEIDILSESSLSDELDRALDGPGETTPEAAAPPATAEPAAPAESALPDEPASDESGAGPKGGNDAEAPAPEPEPEPEPEVEFEPEAGGAEPVEEADESADEAEFFDQDDPLEATPEFLEETPEHDRLWFEQKEPKDFDFGD